MLAIPPLWWELYEDWNQFTEMESTNKTRMKKLLLLQRVQNHLGDKTAFSDWWGRGTVTLHDMVYVELCDMIEVVVVIWQVLVVVIVGVADMPLKEPTPEDRCDGCNTLLLCLLRDYF